MRSWYFGSQSPLVANTCMQRLLALCSQATVQASQTVHVCSANGMRTFGLAPGSRGPAGCALHRSMATHHSRSLLHPGDPKELFRGARDLLHTWTYPSQETRTSQPPAPASARFHLQGRMSPKTAWMPPTASSSSCW